MVSKSAVVHHGVMEYLAPPPPPPPPWPPPPPPWGATACSTSTFHACPSHPCFCVGHTDAMDTWGTSQPALLDREGLFSPWYIRLLHVLGIRPQGLVPARSGLLSSRRPDAVLGWHGGRKKRIIKSAFTTAHEGTRVRATSSPLGGLLIFLRTSDPVLLLTHRGAEAPPHWSRATTR